MSAVTLPRKVEAWRIAVRPRTLLLSLVPVALGTAVASHSGGIHWPAAVAALLGALFLQIAANVANDVYDFKKGADTPDRQGPTRAAAAGLLSVRELMWGLILFVAVALAIGIYLGTLAGWPLIVLAIVATLSAIAYTAGPYPLAYHGLGDLFVMVFFGLIAVAGTTYVQTQALPALAFLLGGSVGALATAVLNVNNIRDIATDARVGKLTLPVRLGPVGARVYYTALLAVAYAGPGVAIAFGYLSRWGLLVLLTVPLAIRLAVLVWRGEGPVLNRALAGTVGLQLLFGLTLLPGFFGVESWG